MAGTVEYGVFGGSAFYSLLDPVEETEIDTPFGSPSDRVAVGQLGGRSVAFIPRHGRDHSFPPHTVPYRANVWAMKELGVKRLFGPCAAGSLQPHVRPGDFVVCDQLVDRTSGRTHTFYDGPGPTHISFADPYCPTMREALVAGARANDISVHERGTVVVVEGPRFSTRAESGWYSSQGWEVVNMTQHPEAALARELEMCYANVSLITDYDVGVEDVEPVSVTEVARVFEQNNAKLRDLLFEVIPKLPPSGNCPCSSALDGARF